MRFLLAVGDLFPIFPTMLEHQILISPADPDHPRAHPSYLEKLLASRGLLGLAVGLSLVIALGVFAALPARTTSQHDNASAPIRITALAPDYISERDRTIYQSAFALQERGEFAAVDTMLPQLDNKILVGHVLAQRYLNEAYPTRQEELLTEIRDLLKKT